MTSETINPFAASRIDKVTGAPSGTVFTGSPGSVSVMNTGWALMTLTVPVDTVVVSPSSSLTVTVTT